MSTTIRVDDETAQRLRALSRRSGKPIIDVVRDAAAALELVRFASTVTAELDALRADEARWSAYLEEAESTTVRDGLA